MTKSAVFKPWAGPLALLMVSSLALASCASTKTATTPTTTAAPPVSNNEAASPDVATPAPAPQPEVQSAPLAPPSGQTGAGTSVGSSPFANLAEAGDLVLFRTDRYDLTDEARSILTRQASWLQANPGKRILIAGNCDERGTREYNLALGARRANAVRDFLVSLNVSPSRLETVSYGKERPLDDRPSEEGWAVNRNAQTTVLD
jgi:peptidoglycan-associated lipoprotein